jgi:hypothetical protein
VDELHDVVGGVGFEHDEHHVERDDHRRHGDDDVDRVRQQRECRGGRRHAAPLFRRLRHP